MSQNLAPELFNRAMISSAQKPAVVWFTGLSGSGKTTTATEVHAQLEASGYRAVVLDGDQLRRGLCADLGFSAEDRRENLRRGAAVAKLMSEAGLIVLAAFISPFQKDRQWLRQQFSDQHFIEVYMSTPIEACERRDPKGLYARARQGLLPGFTGIDAPFETPAAPELVIDASHVSVAAAAASVLTTLRLTSLVI